jgi:hypothetical protein
MPADRKPVAKEPPGDDRDGAPIHTGCQSAAEPLNTESELRKASEDLKARIEEAKRANSIPLDANLGNPAWERSVADGHLDVHDEEEDK